MLRLTLNTLRRRPGGAIASFLATFLGAAILTSFAAMLDVSAAGGVPDTSKETLDTVAFVVGGWGLLLVAFAVSSTLTMSVRQRYDEIALLRSVGATPAQIRRMILGEATLISVAAAILAIPLGVLGSWGLLQLLQSTDQVAESVGYHFGPMALGIGVTNTILAAVLAALITSRRISKMRVADAAAEATTGTPKMSKKRLALGCAFIALGLNLGIVTATVMNGEGTDAMQTAGQASIWFAIGLAILSPALVRLIARFVGRFLETVGGPSGFLTAQNLRRRTHEMASALMPIILFTSAATATLYMQSIDNAAISAEGLVKTNEQRNIETLNFVVVGMIVLFAAIMLVNTLVATIQNRRREFGQQRLAGSTPPQVLGMVSVEGAVLASAGVLFGSIASIVTVIPFSIARTDSVLPDQTIGIYLGVVGTAALTTLAASLIAARRTIRGPAVEAVAA